MNPLVIFIGAGPVALLAAIELQKKFPDELIILYEKYENPSRHHAMYIDQNSLSWMDRGVGFGKVLDSIPSKVIISDLEKKLREYAETIGIEIRYQEITDFSALKMQFPNTKYFVGSGGLRGVIHPQVFNNENQINEPLRYAVEVKYKALGATRSLNKFTELPGVLSYTNQLVSEYVGHLKADVTPVSLRIFIDDVTYQAMKEATFKNPFTLADQDKIPPDLYHTIVTYLDARKHMANEIIEENSLKISTITLSLYASKKFCKKEGDNVIFQIGEEAFACPFYRSFNDNAALLKFFITSMTALVENRDVSTNKMKSLSFLSANQEIEPLEYYQQAVQRFVDSEIKTIYLYNSGINLLESSANSTPRFTASKLNLTAGGKMFRRNANRTTSHVDEEKGSKCAIS